ncbi:MAG: cysteine desulfurase family protein [Planctomycetota bacterium]
MTGEIYLDFNATSPLHPAVRDEMQQALEEVPGNPSSPHRRGRRARELLDTARSRVAHALGVDPDEIFFTSGATESNNLAAALGEASGRPFYTTSVEHPSLREPARRRWRRSGTGGEVPVDASGRVEPAALTALPSDAVVSIQWVNNETGVLQDLAALAQGARASGAIVHTDGAQGFFRLPLRIHELGVDAASISSHKALGPVGIGALYVRRGLLVDPVLLGGAQERGVRPGTENVVGACGLGRLAQLVTENSPWDWPRLTSLRDGFVDELTRIDGLELNAPTELTLPNTVSVAVHGLHAETILLHLDREGVAASSGSACARGDTRPSHVLKAMNRPDSAIRSTLRLSFGPSSTREDLARAAAALRRVVRSLRE